MNTGENRMDTGSDEIARKTRKTDLKSRARKGREGSIPSPGTSLASQGDFLHCSPVVGLSFIYAFGMQIMIAFCPGETMETHSSSKTDSSNYPADVAEFRGAVLSSHAREDIENEPAEARVSEVSLSGSA